MLSAQRVSSYTLPSATCSSWRESLTVVHIQSRTVLRQKETKVVIWAGWIITPPSHVLSVGTHRLGSSIIELVVQQKLSNISLLLLPLIDFLLPGVMSIEFIMETIHYVCTSQVYLVLPFYVSRRNMLLNT
jgi:hypothetical protein